ncbi:hypothetical protein [Nocardioides humi]|uniref:hypothetical protein n=1 Tax=Nocardioides humi TaxID=449461 RepID=UPI00319E30ED
MGAADRGQRVVDGAVVVGPVRWKVRSRGSRPRVTISRTDSIDSASDSWTTTAIRCETSRGVSVASGRPARVTRPRAGRSEP